MSGSRDFDDHLEGDELALDPEEEARLTSALDAALRPEPIDPALHERILQLALADPLAPPTVEERTSAERLRSVLEATNDGDEDASLVRALRLAYGVEADVANFAQAAHARAFERAVPRRSNVVFMAFGAVSGVLALAAAFALVLTPLRKESAPRAPHAELLRSRSLGPVLNADASRLTASERMDRIASAREKDLRTNRYARWGVR